MAPPPLPPIPLPPPPPPTPERHNTVTDTLLLLLQGASRWVRVWAVLCRGCFYGFKSERPDETPLLVFLLPQCTVSFLSDSGRRPRKPLSFKLSQPHCRSLYLSADNRQDLATWLQALQLEACRVLPEDDVSSLGTDNGSNASVDDGVASSGGVRRTASSSSLTATTTQERAAGGARVVGSSTRGSESSACSFDSSDESGLASDSSALTSSGRLELTSEDYDGTGSSPRPSTGSRSVQSSPRSAGHWSLAEELWRRHGLVTLDDVNGEAGGGQRQFVRVDGVATQHPPPRRCADPGVGQGQGLPAAAHPDQTIAAEEEGGRGWGRWLHLQQGAGQVPRRGTTHPAR